MTQALPVSDTSSRMALMPGWTVSIEINAPQQLVWEVVTDFAAYSQWNPFVLEAEAEFEVGQTIRFREDLQQFGQYWLEATFISIDAPQGFCWRGHFMAPWLFQVKHHFQVEALDTTHTRFTQVHRNSGMLIPYLTWRGIYAVSHQGYRDFNQALKMRCESR